MVYFLMLLIAILLIAMVYLLVQNNQIKQTHHNNMEKLQGVIASLHQKQSILNDKVLIASEYDSTYLNDMKTLGDNIVELQKVFVEIISNKNNK